MLIKKNGNGKTRNQNNLPIHFIAFVDFVINLKVNGYTLRGRKFTISDDFPVK